MMNSLRTTVTSAWSIVFLMLFWSFFTGCNGPPPNVGEPKVVEPPIPVSPGAEVKVKIDVVSPRPVSYQWKTSERGGKIIGGDKSSAAVWQAPQEPGLYNIYIEVTINKVMIEKSVAIKVEEIPIVETASIYTSTPTPTDTPTSMPTFTDTPTPHPAEEPTQTHTPLAKLTSTATLELVNTPVVPVIVTSEMTLVPTTTVQISGKYYVIQLTNKLGVDVTVEIDWIRTVNGMLDFIRRRDIGIGEQFLLEVADEVYQIIPLRMIQRIDEGVGGHVVTLVNGQKVEGLLDLTLEDPNKKKYELRTASKVVLLKRPEDEYIVESSEQKSAELWQFHLQEPAVLTHSVSNVRFAFQYYGPSGWALGGTVPYETDTQSFYLKIGDEEILANLADFEEITFERNNQIKVKAKTGIETVGTLVLKPGSDENGRDEWFLVMDLTDSEMAIAVKNPRGTLRKISN